MQQKEREVSELLDKIEDLERQKPEAISETVLPEAPAPKVLKPNTTTSVQVECKVEKEDGPRTDIIDGEDELE